MKTILSPLALLTGCAIVLCSFFAIGCSKNSSTTSSDPSSNNGFGYFTCNVNGSSWSTGGYSTDPTAQSVLNKPMLYLTGFRSYNSGNTVDQLEVNIRNFHGIGTYKMSDQVHMINHPDDTIAVGIFVTTGGPDPANQFVSDSGATNNVVVTAYNDSTRHVSGTFQFNAISALGTKNFTNGKFDLTLPN